MLPARTLPRPSASADSLIARVNAIVQDQWPLCEVTPLTIFRHDLGAGMLDMSRLAISIEDGLGILVPSFAEDGWLCPAGIHAWIEERTR